MTHYAHSYPGTDDKTKWETMSQHEQQVASRCRLFLARIHEDLGDWGNVLGRWHDLGKYLPDFQRRLTGDAVQVEHAGAGAALAESRSPLHTIPIQFVIAGHHAGLANQIANEHVDGKAKGISRIPLQQRLLQNRSVAEQVSKIADSATLELELPRLDHWLRETSDKDDLYRQIDVFTRIQFSALVDADRLATQNFRENLESRISESTAESFDSIPILRDRFDQHVDTVSESRLQGDKPIDQLRRRALHDCRVRASAPGGIFALTVPTGGGKTFSAMSFALNHAVKNKLDRVIVVIPYTSIIRQNANVYRKAFAARGQALDSTNVIEHHSGFDSKQAREENPVAEKRREFAAENWDAPIIVTTSVQFFETLFTDHPSRSRKLHRIASSVVILDEIQTLPPQYVIPITDMIREFADRYRTSFVLSTATPPALKQHLGSVREIVNDPGDLARHPAARRVQTEWRIDNSTSYTELAEEMKNCGHDQVLAIVHRRRDAVELARLLPERSRVHLSANMCPEHRIRTVDKIVRLTKEKRPCLAVTTQLIEAEVDLDMPIVYRALAGADSLAQAAGRCDREGIRSEAAGEPTGRLIVFKPETKPPSETLRIAAEATRTVWRSKQLQGTEFDLFDPDQCLEYFQHFYNAKNLDQNHIQRERASLNFANVAALFEMIDDGWSFPIVVPWPFNDDGSPGEGRRRAAAFREEPCRDTARDLQPYTVQIPKFAVDTLEQAGVIEIIDESVGLPTDLFDEAWYSDEFGLHFNEDTVTNPITFIT